MDEKTANILIVDDVAMNARLLVNLLQDEDYNLAVATNGQMALDLVDDRKPDLILLDIMMPNMDGYETCRRLKASEDTRDIPVIFLTARTEAEDITKGFDVGAVDYVTKPFNYDELIARVKTHLELKITKDALERSNQEQRKLIHILCHDLINPLGQVETTLDLMKIKPEAFERVRDALSISVANGLNIINMVRQMRDLQEYDLELQGVSLKTALFESLSMLHHRFEEKKIELLSDTDSPVFVLAEKTSLVNSVLNNLLTNAIKFSPTGSVVEVKVEESTETITVSVIDHGIGMPQSLLDDVFDEGKKTTREGTDGEVGTGFGLPLVKKFVEAYGGSIKATSREIDTNPDDHGTEVTFQLKVYQP